MRLPLIPEALSSWLCFIPFSAMSSPIAVAIAACSRLRGLDFLEGGMAGSLTHSAGKELGHAWRNDPSDNRIQTSLRAFSLPERPPISRDLALLGDAVREQRERRRLSQGE